MSPLLSASCLFARFPDICPASSRHKAQRDGPDWGRSGMVPRGAFVGDQQNRCTPVPDFYRSGQGKFGLRGAAVCVMAEVAADAVWPLRDAGRRADPRHLRSSLLRASNLQVTACSRPAFSPALGLMGIPDRRSLVR